MRYLVPTDLLGNSNSMRSYLSPVGSISETLSKVFSKVSHEHNTRCPTAANLMKMLDSQAASSGQVSLGLKTTGASLRTQSTTTAPGSLA